ncbi:MAG: EscU/YscU/HrcU family type III secretion system export apparatus switch protein [Treponema sp.]|nr:EscU/YscU/HrcU family type III secretion system export apparatus switch protein [Treponema sp.]
MNGSNEKRPFKQVKKAVALKYPHCSPAPFITVTACGGLAEKLVRIAEENSIPVVKNDTMADVLSVEEIGSFVPEETWNVLAGIFAFVLSTEGRQKK